MIKEYDPDFYCRIDFSDPNEAAFIAGSNYEDGVASTIWKAGKWWYRSPWTGEDTLVPGGFKEVIAHWLCHIQNG